MRYIGYIFISFICEFVLKWSVGWRCRWKRKVNNEKVVTKFEMMRKSGLWFEEKDERGLCAKESG